MQHEIFRVNTLRKLSSQHDLGAFRNLHPQLAGEPNRGHFGIPDTASERSEAAIDRAVRVRADDQISGRNVSGFHQNQMRDARIDIVEFPDAILLHEIPALLMVRRILLRLCRRDVIQDNGDPVRVVQLRGSDLFHDADGPPCRGVAHHQIGKSVHNLARRDGRETGFLRQDFLCDRHFHTLRQVRNGLWTVWKNAQCRSCAGIVQSITYRC